MDNIQKQKAAYPTVNDKGRSIYTKVTRYRQTWC